MNTVLEIAARNAIAACLLAGVVFALCVVIRRPAIRNALWLIVLIRLVLPPIWTVPIPGLTAPNAIPTPVSSTTAVTESNLPALAPATDVEGPSLWSRIARWLFPGLIGLWAIGSLVIVTLTVRRMGRFQRGLSDAVLAPPESQQQAREIASSLGLKKCPAIWLVNGRVPPMLWMPGLFARQARLIFPMDLFFGLDQDKRAALIAHELAHLRRRDPWVRWLELSTVALYWWHPLLGFIRRQLRESEEQCCDELVVTKMHSRKAYASALVETVIFLDGPAPVPGLASGASPVHDLKQRVSTILRGAPRNQLTRLGNLALVVVAVGALGIGPAFSKEPTTEANRPNEMEQLAPRSEAEKPQQETQSGHPANSESLEYSPLPLERRVVPDSNSTPARNGNEAGKGKDRVGASFTKNGGI